MDGTENDILFWVSLHREIFAIGKKKQASLPKGMSSQKKKKKKGIG